MLSSLVRRLKNIFLLDNEVKLEKKKNSVVAQRNLLVERLNRYVSHFMPS